MPHNILYVDDEVQNLGTFARVFFDCDFVGKVFTASSAEEGIGILEENDVAVVVTDQRMPGVTGTEFLARIIKDHADTVRLILTAYTDVREIIDAINRGHVYYYITKPWQPDELKVVMRRALEHYETTLELRRKNRELELAYRHLEMSHQEQVRLYEMVITDEKTGVRNYHYFRIRLAEEFERAHGSGTQLALALLDIDSFKAINDKHGLLAGDRVLREVAQLLAAGAGRTEVLARYGGEEFALLLPGHGLEEARARLERLRVEVGDRTFRTPSGGEVRLSLSCGVAAYPGGDIGSREDLVQRADEALYRAKAHGRNRVEVDR